MTLVPLPHVMAHARANGFAVGYFESWDSYSLEAVLDAAEQEDSPVIVGFGATMLSDEWLNDRGIPFLGASGRALIEGCRVPVSFLLNETHTLEQALVGIDCGFNAVMIDSHRWPVPEAITATSTLVSAAHAAGVAVEAEFGSLPDYIGEEIVAGNSYMTDPTEAANFVSTTGVDVLAVAVGNVHLLTDFTAEIDVPRVAEISSATNIPLAIHGGTGFPAEAVAAVIANGVTKFNVGTRLKKNYLEAVLERTRDWHGQRLAVHDLVGSHKDSDFQVAGKAAITTTVRDFMRLYGSSGKANAVRKAIDA